MNRDAVIGGLVIGAALGLITYLVLWSRRTINRIADSKRNSLRDIVKELKSER